jgi:hypothetical protein
MRRNKQNQPKGDRKMKMSKVFAVACVMAAGLVGSFTQAEAATQGKVTVIHGISGLPQPVDVYANGNFLFSFDFKDVKGPLSLDPGAYNLEVKLGGQVVLSGTANVEAGKDYTVVAHFTYTGADPGIKLSVFENTTTTVCNKQLRLTVRHLADAPAVDAVVSPWWTNQRILGLPNLASAESGNPQGGAVDLLAWYYRVQLYVAGTTASAYNSGKLKLDAGKSYIAYAIGSLPENTFTVYLQAIELPTFSCR